MNKDMIGVVGGMGSYAAARFFTMLLDAFPAEKEWDRPRIIIDNNCVMPSRVRAILYNENIAELTEALTESVTGLTARGCNHVILACITSHYFLEGLALSSPQRDCVVDLLKATAESCAGVGKLKILCTEGTAQSRLFDKYFGGKSGLTVYPDEGELTALRAYIEAVKQNRITSGITASFADFAANLPYENIVLGCTELSVLFDNADIGAKRIIDPLKCGITELKERLTR